MKTRHFYFLGALMASLIGLSGCATSEKVQTIQTGDNRLSCSQIKTELGQLDHAQKVTDEKKGVTGTNVAAAVFFWPALAYTEYDASKATDSISARKSTLTALFNHKCS